MIKKRITHLLILMAPFVGLYPALLQAESPKPVFATWDIFEVDKCASIWLIKRFIDGEAEIRLHPKGTLIRKGIAFDTPDAKFRRYHNASTYEVLLRHYRITDSRCVHIGKIIHDIEVNVWEKKKMPESRYVMQAISDIITGQSSSHVIITRSFAFFDTLYQQLSP